MHVGARIVSGSFLLRLGGSRPSRNNDYATCGHVISASNTTDDSSRHWAPVPPVAAITAVTPMDRALEVDWTQAEHYPGHSGAIVQWHGPGGNFDAPPEQGVSFAADAQGATITGLTNGVLYTVRVISTRRFAHEDALPSAEATGRPAVPAAAATAMTDLALAWNNRLGAGDICVVGADLLAEDGIDTAILISLFTDARVREDELPPGHTWRRGWWGDDVEDEPDITGSKLWVLRREKATQEVLVRARGYIREALAWMLRDGVAVSLNVDTNYSAPGVMQIFIEVVEPDRTLLEFQFTDVLGDT